MDGKSNDQDVLLVKEKDKDTVKIVAGIENDGTPKTVESYQENEPQFLKIDKHGNVLDNFMSNYMRQYKDPTHFQFFKAPLNKDEEVAKQLQEAFKNPNDPSCKEFTDLHKVEPVNQTQKQSDYTIDKGRIDWTQLERLGVTRETLERTKSLEAMLNRQKSPVLIPITAKFDETVLRTDARLSFRETSDGKLTLAIHAIHKEPELNKPYFGIRFTDEDKHNLLTTGNLGRVVNAEYKQGEKTPVFISVDRLTNELVALRADKINIPANIKGISLDEYQKQNLAEGKEVYLEGMLSKSGKEFSAYAQINADKRGLEFHFNSQFPHIQNQTQQYQGNNEVRIPKTLLGAEISEIQQEQLREGKTVYIAGMKDEKGGDFNAYVKVNNEKGKLDFFKWNPEKSNAKEVMPDNKSKTQVTVNNNSTNNEFTTKDDKSFKSGQSQSTGKQSNGLEKEKVHKTKQKIKA
ncbi:MAG: DUF3945 domain-containing protein [Bacteroidota bacterium]|nr:DUF3945 domain-containing protein [Bacteroidota bacterium]